jgi:hypothetical protein
VDGTSPVISHDAPVTFPLGVTIVTFSATDAAGNSATATASVTVADTTKPVITVNGNNPYTFEVGVTYVDPLATMTDNVDATNNALVGTSTVNSGVVGHYTVTYNSADLAGNVAVTEVRDVYVQDSTAPVVTAPAAITVAAEGASGTVATNAVISAFLTGVTVLDNVDGTSPVISHDAPVTFPLGVTIVTFSATDAAGNSATATASVTISTPDRDGDGIVDINDAFPADAAASVDSDGDGYPDSWNDGNTEADSTTGLVLDIDPTSSAVAHFTFNDYTPGLLVTADSSGYGNDGVIFGGVIDGGLAMSFIGVDGLITSPAIAPSTDYTAMMWFNTSVANAGLFSVAESGGENDRNIYLDASGNLCARVLNVETICTNNVNYADGSWHHVAHRLDVSGQTLFADGSTAATGSFGTSAFDWNTQIELGWARGEAGSGYFNGLIDEVRVDASALSDADIYALGTFTDSDSDGVADFLDAFPNDASKTTDTDNDNDGVLDVNDDFYKNAAASVDTDSDGKPDSFHESCDVTCVADSGLELDLDDDGDGVEDNSDAFPLDTSELVDTDGDGVGNNADTDDDNDGISDADEIEMGTDPIDPSDCLTCGPKSWWRFKLMQATL